MTSPTSSSFTQFHSNTHPQHSHRFGSTSSTSSTGSHDYSGPNLSSHHWTNTTPDVVKSRRFSTNEDPFAAHRDPNDNPFASTSASGARRESEPMTPIDRRMSREWDASKVPPSKFQRLPGSIFATPASRDGLIARNKLTLSSIVDKAKDKVHHSKK